MSEKIHAHVRYRNPSADLEWYEPALINDESFFLRPIVRDASRLLGSPRRDLNEGCISLLETAFHPFQSPRRGIMTSSRVGPLHHPVLHVRLDANEVDEFFSF